MEFKQFLTESVYYEDLYQDPRGDSFYLMDVRKDSFIHFTPKERIDDIIKSNRLMLNPPHGGFGIVAVAAISTMYGKIVPSVQTTHLKRPMEDLSTILFKTSIKPDVGYKEEVLWHEDVIFDSVKVIDVKDAIELVSNSPMKIDDNSQVLYDEKKFMEIRNYWEKKGK